MYSYPFVTYDTDFITADGHRLGCSAASETHTLELQSLLYLGPRKDKCNRLEIDKPGGKNAGGVIRRRNEERLRPGEPPERASKPNHWRHLSAGAITIVRKRGQRVARSAVWWRRGE